MRVGATLLLLGVAAWAETRIETGQINGSEFQIAIPEGWAGDLVMYCRGGGPPLPYPKDRVDPALEPLLAQGVAIAQSGYFSGGWAVEDALLDTEQLRRYFSLKYRTPKSTYVVGHSLGGHVAAALVESAPHAYTGGLAACAPLAPASWVLERVVFDTRVVFDYYFPGVLDPLPSEGSDFDPKQITIVLAALNAEATRSAAMRQFTGIRNNSELAQALVTYTYILKDLRRRTHGNAFDNSGTIYKGTSDDDALNQNVRRYRADPVARGYVQRHYPLTGKLDRPLLSIQTTYDPLTPAWLTNAYAKLAEAAGAQDFFAQERVTRAGHCTMTPTEIGEAFHRLKLWAEQGRKP